MLSGTTSDDRAPSVYIVRHWPPAGRAQPASPASGIEGQRCVRNVDTTARAVGAGRPAAWAEGVQDLVDWVLLTRPARPRPGRGEG